ncbi:MAG: hypothetical protein Ta2A_19890 [Treponemataceae bacterium]|nr:MAG: hypothetical protein Ta2A_19890 [Treponemataceae bacterium]
MQKKIKNAEIVPAMVYVNDEKYNNYGSGFGSKKNKFATIRDGLFAITVILTIRLKTVA